MSAAVDDAPGAVRRPAGVLFGPEPRRIGIGVMLILVTLYGQQLYGWATSDSRLHPSLAGATRPANVIVVLDFQPERFHSERIQQYGAFAGRDGGLNRIRLRNVTPARLRELAAIPWVARIVPMR